MPIATTGGMPAKSTSSGVISEPPPIPVRPMRMPTPKPKAMTSGSIGGRQVRRAARTRSCRCPPSGRRGRCRAACTARSRSTRSPRRAAGGRAGRARGCASTGRARSSARAGCTSRSRRAWRRPRRSSVAARVGPCSRRRPVIQASAPASARSSAATFCDAAAVLGPGPRRRAERLLDLDAHAEALLERAPRRERLGEQHAGVDRHDADVRRDRQQLVEDHRLLLLKRAQEDEPLVGGRRLQGLA